MLDEIRVAFDGDDVPRKNIALRKAHDKISRIRDALAAFASMDTMNPPEGVPLNEWLPAVTGARAALREAYSAGGPSPSTPLQPRSNPSETEPPR